MTDDDSQASTDDLPIATRAKRRHRTRKLNKSMSKKMQPVGFAAVAAALDSTSLSPEDSDSCEELDPLDFPENPNYSEFIFVPTFLDCGFCGERRNACRCLPLSHRFACNFGILDKFFKK